MMPSVKERGGTDYDERGDSSSVSAVGAEPRRRKQKERGDGSFDDDVDIECWRKRGVDASGRSASKGVKSALADGIRRSEMGQIETSRRANRRVCQRASGDP